MPAAHGDNYRQLAFDPISPTGFALQRRVRLTHRADELKVPLAVKADVFIYGHVQLRVVSLQFYYANKDNDYYLSRSSAVACICSRTEGTSPVGKFNLKIEYVPSAKTCLTVLQEAFCGSISALPSNATAFAH